MHNVASYLPDVCPGHAASNRARVGFVVPAEQGPRVADSLSPQVVNRVIASLRPVG